MKKLVVICLAMMMSLGFAMPVFADDDPPGMDSDHDMSMKGGMMGGMREGMMGMHGDIDMMTRPKMQKSCRTPEFYIMRADDLGLSDNQVESLNKLDSALKKDMILKGAAVKVLEMDLSDIVVRPDFKLGDAQAKLKEIEKARTELRTTVIKASSDARGLLAPEQIEKLKDMGIRCAKMGCDKMGCDKGCIKHGPAGAGEKKQMMMEKMKEQMMKENMP